MRATKAYIASLGTTGVLLAASLLMLAVVSAVVAFDRWPGASVQAPAKTLVLEDKAPEIRVSATSTGPSATAARTAAGGVPAAALAPRRTFNGGGVAGQRFTSPPATGGPSPVAPPVLPPVLPHAPDAPNVPDPEEVIGSISPDTTATQVADGTQSVTDQAGLSLGRVSPDIGNTVAATGQQVSQTVRELPLPGQVIPGK
jgi:hypothetical protein